MNKLNYIGLFAATLALASLSLSAGSSGSEREGVIYPPYLNTFDDSSALDGFANINCNPTESQRWDVFNGYARMMNSEYRKMDSWLITPGIMLQNDKLYEVSLDARVEHRLYPERIEVYAGSSQTPEGMTMCVIEKTDLKTNSYVKLRGYLKVETNGVYYVGLHGCSDPDSYFLVVDNLSITEGAASVTPDQVTGLKVTPDPLGNLSADISFTTPTVDIDGNKLSPVTKVEVLRGGTVIKTFENPGEGVALSYKDNVEKAGTYTYTVVCYNEAGRGKEAVEEVFIGISLPGAPQNAKVEETSNEGEVKISWTAPTTDNEGRPINPDLITYTIVDSFTQMPIDEYLTETEYVFTPVAPGSQDFVQYGIFASTSAGMNAKAAMTDMLPVGKAYTLPVEESFGNGMVQHDYVWGNAADPGSSSWIELITDKNGVSSQDGDNGYVGCFSQNESESASLYTGKINVGNAENPIISFYYYKFQECENTVTVLVDSGNGPVEAGAFVCGPESEGWTRAVVPLSDYRNKDIRITFRFTSISHNFTVIDNIAILDQQQCDLAAVSLAVPMNVNAGDKAMLKANIANVGSKDVESYVVNLYCNGKIVQTCPGTMLQSGKNKIISFEENPGLDSKSERVYKAEVTCDGDTNRENNLTKESSMFVILPSYPAPTDLKANLRDNSVELTWTSPDMENMPSEPMTDDVEQYESFAVNSAGDWKFIDGDLGETYGFTNVSFPNEESAMAWMVFDSTDIYDKEAFGPHSGVKFFASMASRSLLNDDWLISPELDGHAQTVSFYARAVDFYEESFEFLYSTGGTAANDFIKVGAIASVPSAEWKKYSFVVPAGAKYFAIRCVSADALGLLVDDITFAAANAPKMVLEFKGYNVYRDGVKLNDALVKEQSYTENFFDSDVHKYFVTAVYDKGESAASNVATGAAGVESAVIDAIGIMTGNGTIVVTGALGCGIEVYTIDGIRMFSGIGTDSTSINVDRGAYIVKAGTKVAKVIVR